MSRILPKRPEFGFVPSHSFAGIRRFGEAQPQLGEIRKSISAISRTQLGLLQDGDVGIGVFLSEF
jgi:hypothetical protein